MKSYISEQEAELRIVLSDVERLKVIELLRQNELPFSDLGEDTLLYSLWNREEVIGTGGLEIYGDCALLRSISVDRLWQRQGFGRKIMKQLESHARDAGIRCLYLLTTTAKEYFEKLGYCQLKRENAPTAIQQTSEFKGVCPTSAILMQKTLG